MFKLNTSVGLVAATVLVSLFSFQAANAQYKYETPDGHQTVAPSQMYQQQSVGQLMSQPSNINRNVSPPSVGVDMPGLPGVNIGSKTPSAGRTTANQPGALVLPQGETSTLRVGPIQPVPLWGRILLAAWLLLQIVVASIVAFTMQRRKYEYDREFQGGHIINEDSSDRPLGTPELT